MHEEEEQKISPHHQYEVHDGSSIARSAAAEGSEITPLLSPRPMKSGPVIMYQDQHEIEI